MSDEPVQLPSNKVNDEFLSQPTKLEDASISALADSGLLHCDWSQDQVELALAKRIRDAVTPLQGFGKGFADRHMSQRLLDVLKSISAVSHAFVEGHQPREDCILNLQDFGTLLRPQGLRRFQGLASYEEALNQAEATLSDGPRISFRQCRDAVKSGFEWEPRQRALILDPAREYLAEALLDPDASDVAELWFLDGMLGMWQRDEAMLVERSFDRGIRCKSAADPFVLSLLHRFKAFAAAQDCRYTQAYESAQASVKIREDWATYLEVAHYSLHIDNQHEAITAIRNAVRLFPLCIAIIVASDNLSQIWTTIDANFIRYLDDFRSHSISELNAWDTAYSRARHVNAAGINFEIPSDLVPDAERLRYQLDQEKGLRLITIPSQIRGNAERLNIALNELVTSQLSHRWDELRAIKAEAKLAEAGRKVGLAEAEKEIKSSTEILKAADKSTKLSATQSLTACASLFGLSMLLFVATSVMSVLFKDGIFKEFSNLNLVCFSLSVIPALFGMGYHISVVARISFARDKNKQKLRRLQREYEDRVNKIEAANSDRTSYHEKRVALAEARYRCAQEAERALRGETFKHKGNDHDELNFRSAA